MKRLLCIMSNMNAGGAETFLMKLYREIDRTQYQMDFCVNVREKNYYEDEIYELGGRIYRIPSRTESFREHNKELINIVKRHSYLYVMVISASATAYLDLKIAKKAGAKVTCIRSSNSNYGKGIRLKARERVLKTFFSRYADVKIAPSDLAAINLFGENYLKDKKFRYIRNGVNLETYKYSDESRRTRREELDVSEDTILIGHIGRFFLQKNHDFVVDVFEKYHKTNPKSKLLLIGSGELEEKIKEKVRIKELSESVIFAGTRSDIPQLLSAMDLFIFPSLYEGMPNTVIEAQVSGLHCLLSDTITREADISGRVKYISLQDKEKWVNEMVCGQYDDRERVYKELQNSDYNITNTVCQFIQYVFNEC